MGNECGLPSREERAGDYVLGRLSEPERLAFEDHLAGCGACAGRVMALHEGLDRLERDTSQPLSGWRSAWDALAGTLLAPVPALVYLAALLLAFPVLRLAGPSREPEAPSGARALAAVPRVVKLFPEPIYRGLLEGTGGPPEAFPPAEIPERREGGSGLLLELHTGFPPEDLQEPGASFRVELREGDRLLWSSVPSGSDLDPSGILRVILDGEQLSPGKIYSLEVRTVRPGGSGEVLFHRGLRLKKQ